MGMGMCQIVVDMRMELRVMSSSQSSYLEHRTVHAMGGQMGLVGSHRSTKYYLNIHSVDLRIDLLSPTRCPVLVSVKKAVSEALSLRNRNGST